MSGSNARDESSKKLNDLLKKLLKEYDRDLRLGQEFITLPISEQNELLQRLLRMYIIITNLPKDVRLDPKSLPELPISGPIADALTIVKQSLEQTKNDDVKNDYKKLLMIFGNVRELLKKIVPSNPSEQPTPQTIVVPTRWQMFSSLSTEYDNISAAIQQKLKRIEGLTKSWLISKSRKAKEIESLQLEVEQNFRSLSLICDQFVDNLSILEALKGDPALERKQTIDDFRLFSNDTLQLAEMWLKNPGDLVIQFCFEEKLKQTIDHYTSQGEERLADLIPKINDSETKRKILLMLFLLVHHSKGMAVEAATIRKHWPDPDIQYEALQLIDRRNAYLQDSDRFSVFTEWLWKIGLIEQLAIELNKKINESSTYAVTSALYGIGEALEADLAGLIDRLSSLEETKDEKKRKLLENTIVELRQELATSYTKLTQLLDKLDSLGELENIKKRLRIISGYLGVFSKVEASKEEKFLQLCNVVGNDTTQSKFWKENEWMEFVETQLLEKIGEQTVNQEQLKQILEAYYRNKPEHFLNFVISQFKLFTENNPLLLEQVIMFVDKENLMAYLKLNRQNNKLPTEKEFLNWLSIRLQDNISLASTAIGSCVALDLDITTNVRESINKILACIKDKRIDLFSTVDIPSFDNNPKNMGVIIALIKMYPEWLEEPTKKTKIFELLSKNMTRYFEGLTAQNTADYEDTKFAMKLILENFDSLPKFRYGKKGVEEFTKTVQMILASSLENKEPLKLVAILLEVLGAMPGLNLERNADTAFSLLAQIDLSNLGDNAAKKASMFAKSKSDQNSSPPNAQECLVSSLKLIYQNILKNLKSIFAAEKNVDQELLQNMLVEMFKVRSLGIGQEDIYRAIVSNAYGVDAKKNLIMQALLKAIFAANIQDKLESLINDTFKRMQTNAELIAAYTELKTELYRLKGDAKFYALLSSMGVDLQKPLPENFSDEIKRDLYNTAFPQSLAFLIADLRAYAIASGETCSTTIELLDFTATRFNSEEKQRFIKYINVLLRKFVSTIDLDNAEQKKEITDVVKWLGQVSYTKDGIGLNLSGAEFLENILPKDLSPSQADDYVKKVPVLLQAFLKNRYGGKTHEDANPFVLLSKFSAKHTFADEKLFLYLYELAKDKQEPWLTYWVNCGNKNASVILYLCRDAQFGETVDKRKEVLNAALELESIFEKMDEEFFMGFSTLEEGVYVEQVLAKLLPQHQGNLYSLLNKLNYAVELWKNSANSLTARVALGAHDEELARLAKDISKKYYSNTLKSAFPNTPTEMAEQQLDLDIYFILLKQFIDQPPANMNDKLEIQCWQNLCSICGIGKDYLENVRKGSVIPYEETKRILMKKFKTLPEALGVIQKLKENEIPSKLYAMLQVLMQSADSADSRDVDQFARKGNFADPEAKQFIRYCALLVVGDRSNEVGELLKELNSVEEKLSLMRGKFGHLESFKKIYERGNCSLSLLELAKQQHNRNNLSLKQIADFDTAMREQGISSTENLVPAIKKHLTTLLHEAEQLYIQQFVTAVESAFETRRDGNTVEYIPVCRTGILVNFLTGIYNTHYMAPTTSRSDLIVTIMRDIFTGGVENLFDQLPKQDREKHFKELYDSLFCLDTTNWSTVLIKNSKPINSKLDTISCEDQMTSYTPDTLDKLRSEKLLAIYGELDSLFEKVKARLPETLQKHEFTAEEKFLILKLACDGPPDQVLSDLAKMYFLEQDSASYKATVHPTSKP